MNIWKSKPFLIKKTGLRLIAKTAKQAGLLAAQYRKAYQGISLEDYLLAATAEQLNCPL